MGSESDPVTVSAATVHQQGQASGEGNSRIVDLCLPLGISKGRENRLDKLLHADRPFPYPFRLTAHDKRAVDPFSLERPDLVGTDALRQPYGTINRHILVQALLQQHLALDSVGYCAAQTPQWDRRIREVLEPYLPLRIRDSHTWWRFEGRRSRHLAGMPSMSKHRREDCRQRVHAALLLQHVEERRLRRCCLVLTGRGLVKITMTDDVIGELVFRVIPCPRVEIRITCCSRRTDVRRRGRLQMYAISRRGWGGLDGVRFRTGVFLGRRSWGRGSHRCFRHSDSESRASTGHRHRPGISIGGRCPGRPMRAQASEIGCVYHDSRWRKWLCRLEIVRGLAHFHLRHGVAMVVGEFQLETGATRPSSLLPRCAISTSSRGKIATVGLAASIVANRRRRQVRWRQMLELLMLLWKLWQVLLR